jgi:hypothetical protein
MVMFLSDAHRADLMKSGLTVETIRQSRIYSAPEPQVRDILGYPAGSGMVIPYAPLNADGSEYARVKLDNVGPDGKRYLSPKGRPNRLYVPPILDPSVLRDPSVTLYVTEGEKKAAKATQEGFPCIGLSGVWGWRTKDADGASTGTSVTTLSPRRRSELVGKARSESTFPCSPSQQAT